MNAIQAYALSKKLIASSTSGISNIQLDASNNMVFTLQDGSSFSIPLPNMKEGYDYSFVSSLPTTDISNKTVYIAPVGSEYYQYLYYNNNWVIIGISGVQLATSTSPGIVQVDNSTIVIDSNGVISVKSDYISNNINVMNNNDIESLF